MNVFAVPSAEHNDPTHPENAARIPAVLSALAADAELSPLVARPACPELHPERSRRIAEGPPATEAQLASVHDPQYIAVLRQAMSRAPAIIDYAPTYITPHSFDCAAQAAGAALAAVNSAITPIPPHPHTSSFALIRPPGHHAPPAQAMGFCLFNNIALAARGAQKLGAGQVMIVDFDVHHGNGTQAAFYADPSVLFISTHQSGIYPGTGHAGETGEGGGEGYTINVPLPGGAGDRAFARIMSEIVGPAADRFRPDILLISAGYDAHWRDPLAGLQLSCAGYHALGATLTATAKKHCGGKLVFVLEGGYDLLALAGGVVNTMRGALGLPAADPLGPASH
ncbi:MAG: histone deacetylase, partial [Chloroflexota bacterium]